MSDLIRSAALTPYPEVARSVGLDPRAMLRKARLPLESLERPDMRIAASSVRRLLQISAAASGVEEFGLRMAASDTLYSLGMVALLAREQETVGGALKALARYIHVHHEGLRYYIEPQDDLVTLSVGMRGIVPRPSYDLALGGLHRTIRKFAGANWRPLETHMTHPTPRNRDYYRQFFGCPITYNSEINALVFSARDLDLPIATSNPQIASYIEQRVEAIDARPERWDARVAEMVRTLLPEGKCSADRVAEHFACTRRTLHRHLEECGTSFSGILDAERADLALRLIEDPNRPLASVAEMLGFSAQSAMARWFKGRFGRSITEWRRSPYARAPAAIRRK